MGGVQEVGKERARGRSFKRIESGINKGKLHECLLCRDRKMAIGNQKRAGVGNAMYKTQKTLTPFKSPYHDTLSGLSIKRFQST